MVRNDLCALEIQGGGMNALQAAMLNITLWFVMMILYHIASQLSRIAKSLEKKNDNSSQ